MSEVFLTSAVSLGAASSAPEPVSPEQIQLAEATDEQPPAELQVQQSNGHNSALQPKIDTQFSAGEVFEQLQPQARTSSAASAAVSATDTGYESVATSMQSLDVSSDGTESAVEQFATLDARKEQPQSQPQQEEWICLSTPDGYWYWLNTVTGVSQWVETQERQEPAVNWLHKYAVAGGVQEVQQVLSSEGVDVNGTNEQGQTALHLVCGLRYPSQQTLTIAEMLLRFGADVNAQDRGGNTPLHGCATTSGAPSFISLLLAYGARPYVINSQGHTPLQSAALASNYDAMQTILQFTKSAEASKETRIQWPQRVTSQTVDAQPQTAVAVQPQWERYWTADGIPYVYNKLTGESKWDTDEASDGITASSQDGSSIADARQTNGSLRPLKLRGNREELDRHLQVWSRFFENAFRQRSQFDTPPDNPHTLKPVRATNKRRQLALWPDLPSDDEYAKAVQLSWQPSAASAAEQSASMLMAAMTNDADTVRRFLQAGVPLNATDEMLRSAAHHAAHHDSIDVLVLLQDFGADLDLVDGDVNTPLHVASMRGHVDVVMFLLESAVDVNIQNKNGDTALHLAVKQRQLAVCRQLLEYGADQTLRNNAGYTAQDTASLVAPHQQHMFTASVASLFARGENAASSDNHRPPHDAARVGKTWSSADLRLQIPKQGLPTQGGGGGGGRAPPNSVRQSRRQLRRKGGVDSSLDEDDTGSSEEEEEEESSSSGSDGSAGWSFGSFLYRTTLRLVGINSEHSKTSRSSKRDNDDDEDDDAQQRSSAPPTDAELAAMRTRLPLSSPPTEVVQDIRHKAEEIQRNTPRGREVTYPQVQPPAEVVLAYDMAKAAVRNSPTFPPTTVTGGPSANIYSLASVPPGERRHYIDVFDPRNSTDNNSDQEGRLH